MPAPEPPRFVEVAVPVPLPEALIYEVPPVFAALARPGARARVPVGKRRLVGVVLGTAGEPSPELEGKIRPLEAVIDLQPVFDQELLALGRFVADYYQEPLGEVLRSMLPGDLPPWGDRRAWLTDAGALATPRDERERAVVEALRGAGRLRLSELQAAVGEEELAATVERLQADGRLALAGERRAGARYASAVELAPGGEEELLESCGRSKPGREVVRYLSEVGRPALVSEVLAAVGCTAGVVRRLIELRVLRRFSQIARLSLEDHLLSPEETPEITLRPDQQTAVDALLAALAEGRFAPYLLAGITGSGKTEVYLRVAAAALEAGRTALLMVPEIALVPALARTARQRFGRRVAILHSALASGERHQEWERIRRREARVILGPRSAVFAPLGDLGLVVVDEEQDGAYKQGQAPRYNGRDLALVRGQRAGAVVVLVSATPSLEVRHNVELGKARALELTERVGHGELPEGVLVDLRREGIARRPGEVAFSEPLKEEIRTALDGGGQVVLLRNRRGYAPVLMCRACGEDFRCPDCGLPRTFHRRVERLRCHLCGGGVPAPERCPACGELALEPLGAGTERVEERFAEEFPGVPLGVLDRDTARRRGGLAGVLERFGRGETRVLIGTQMVSKGHHFPEVALAGVLLADTYLGFPDFRAVEKTYALLTQLAGRAGRGDRPGRMVIQTYHPEHYAIQAVIAHDDRAFAAEEMRFRRIFHYPPYTRMVQLVVRGRHRGRAEEAMRELAGALTVHPLADGVRISGPAPAPYERLAGRWRFQLLLRAPSAERLRRLVAVAPHPRQGGVDLVIDVDPYELL